MIIKKIEGTTRNLGAPSDWNGEDLKCGILPIRDIETPEGSFMVSAWELTPIELQALQKGETLKFWIRGVNHPVVALSVGPIA